MDNFSGHELAVQLVGGLRGLSNVRIAWLPANTTSHWQPMDQGIIASFKLQYRRNWVAYMLRQIEAGKNPNKTVSLLKAIQWTRASWVNGVTAVTIQKCWWKSTVIKKPKEVIIEDNNQQADQDDLEAQINTLPGIVDPLTIAEFIQPAAEVIDDQDGDIFRSVVERYSQYKEGEEETDDESDVEVEKVSIAEALRCLDIVRLWKLQQESDDRSTLQALDRLSREILQSKRQTTKQTTIVSFFQK